MKKLPIRQKLIDFIQGTTDKKINALFTLLEEEIKNAALLSENLHRKNLQIDLTQVSWSNYITQEEMQRHTETVMSKYKSVCI